MCSLDCFSLAVGFSRLQQPQFTLLLEFSRVNDCAEESRFMCDVTLDESAEAEICYRWSDVVRRRRISMFAELPMAEKTLQMELYAFGCHVGFRTSSFQLHVSKTFLDCLQNVSEFISIIACVVVSAAFHVMLSILNCNGATWPAGLNEYNAMRAAKAAKDVQAASAELVTGLPAKFDSQLPSDSLDWYMEYLNTQAFPILHRVLRLLCCEQPDNPSGAILLSMARRLCDATLLAELHSVLGVEFQAGRSSGAAVGDGFLAEVEDAEVADSPVIPMPPPQPKPQDKGIPGEGRASP
eukprot:s1170_g21.t1